MTTIRLKIPPTLYRPWKPLYRQRSKKPKDASSPYTPLEQQIFDEAKIKFDERVDILRSIFSQERINLSAKSRFAELQLKAEEKEFRQLIEMTRSANEEKSRSVESSLVCLGRKTNGSWRNVPKTNRFNSNKSKGSDRI